MLVPVALSAPPVVSKHHSNWLDAKWSWTQPYTMPRLQHKKASKELISRKEPHLITTSCIVHSISQKALCSHCIAPWGITYCGWLQRKPPDHDSNMQCQLQILIWEPNHPSPHYRLGPRVCAVSNRESLCFNINFVTMSWLQSFSFNKPLRRDVAV